jgi:hypothetical protein
MTCGQQSTLCDSNENLNARESYPAADYGRVILIPAVAQDNENKSNSD